MLVYPSARVEDVVDTLAGVSFPDPYRWLEFETEEVRKWQREQAELASSHVREWPQFNRLRQLVAQFNTERFVSLPRYAAGRWFRSHVPRGASQAQAIVSDDPMGDGRVLFDPMEECPEHPPFLSWIAPSPDGSILAVGICVDGSENNKIRLIDVATGRTLRDPPSQTLMDNWTGGVQWLRDSSGFFFSGISGAAIEFDQHVYLHRRLPVPITEEIDLPWSDTADYRMVAVAPDGRYITALQGLFEPIPIAFAELKADRLCWRPFITSMRGTVAGHVIGEHYIAVTNVGAPRGRLVAIPLNADDPNALDNWQELVAESNAVLRTVTPVGNALYLTEFADTYARVRIVDPAGNELGHVPLPDRGAINDPPFALTNIVAKTHSKQFLFAFSSLTESPGIYSHTLGRPHLDTLQEPKVKLANAIVEDLWGVSTDGTRVPYHLVRRADVSANKPQPTLIYAYGGFNVPLVPQFPGPMAAFVAAGGVLIHAHLRGGGEFGLTWWQDGRLGKKQNSYDDLYAVAEHLIASGRSAPSLLAVTGSSNGGLMAGVAVTQRPDLWAVAVPRVPRLDLIGACRHAYGRHGTIVDRANVEDPEEVRRLASFSPYHLVRDGVSYPAIFLVAGGADPRCPPWDARKFAARLQRATAGSAPILLHVWENVGHGWATAKDTAVAEHSEWLAFVLRHLGLGCSLEDQ